MSIHEVYEKYKEKKHNGKISTLLELKRRIKIFEMVFNDYEILKRSIISELRDKVKIINEINDLQFKRLIFEFSTNIISNRDFFKSNIVETNDDKITKVLIPDYNSFQANYEQLLNDTIGKYNSFYIHLVSELRNIYSHSQTPQMTTQYIYSYDDYINIIFAGCYHQIKLRMKEEKPSTLSNLPDYFLDKVTIIFREWINRGYITNKDQQIEATILSDIFNKLSHFRKTQGEIGVIISEISINKNMECVKDLYYDKNFRTTSYDFMLDHKQNIGTYDETHLIAEFGFDFNSFLVEAYDLYHKYYITVYNFILELSKAEVGEFVLLENELIKQKFISDKINFEL